MANARILVVEDEVIIAKDIQNTLKRLGYAVSALAPSGVEAIKNVAETHPDLVLMDIVLEGDMDGIETAERIGGLFNIPVVYLTAYADNKTLERAKVTEPYGYILKPFQERELHTTIEMALYKHNMESKLKENKEWLAITLKSIGDAVIATDAKGGVIFMNPVAEVLTGWKQEDAVGKPLKDVFNVEKPLKDVFNIIDKEIGKQPEDPVARILREGVVVGLSNDTVLIAKDGTKRPVHHSGAPIRDDKGNIAGVVLVFRDITERRQAEEALLRSERKFKGLTEATTDWVWEVDAQGVYTYASPKVKDLLGYEASEVLGKTSFDLMPKEEAKRIATFFSEKVMNKEPFYGLENVNRHKDGHLVVLETNGIPVLDEEGQLKGYRGIDRDITERKRAEEGLQAAYDQSVIYSQELKEQIEKRKRTEEEKKKVEAQLLHAQKLEAVGQLAGGVAHDFNNILTGIIGYGNLLNMKLEKDNPLRTYVDQILTSSEKAATLTQSLLAFSRKQILSPQPVELNNIVKKVKKLLLRLISEDILLETILTHKDLHIMADIGQIEQVLLNLATNASDAMPKGGLFTITTELVELDDKFLKTHGDNIKPGMYSLLSVTDTGVGMDENTRKRIFEPFFTTKDLGKGTGLGLSIIYGIVRQHNGYIDVYSEVGKGTTFNMYFPIIESGVEETKPKAPPPPRGGTETVLLAEDDEGVRKLINIVFEQSGYKVIEAVDGEDAVIKFKENKDKIDLVILDVIMPKKHGKMAYEEIKKVTPEIKVILVSGYSADIIDKKGIIEEGINFIPKPIVPNDLLRKVREVLDT
jgi:two-component system cell cycle sensor histidine kinase/response regulator CckA